MLKGEDASLRNHRTVVDAVSLIHGAERTAPLLCHRGHHRLEALVATHATDNEDALLAAVGHGSLRDFNQHGEHRLLQGVA